MCYIFNKAKHAGNYFPFNSHISFQNDPFACASANLSFCTFLFTHYQKHTHSNAGHMPDFSALVPFSLSIMWFWSRGLHAWNLGRSLGLSAKASMTCLLSCSEERLTVESKHQALKELFVKGLWEKERDSIYYRSNTVITEIRAYKNNTYKYV